MYQLHETQRAFLSPFAEFAQAAEKYYSHKLNPMSSTDAGQRMSAGFGLLYRLSKDYEKPEFGIGSVKIGGIDVAVQERVAASKPFCRLIRFKRLTDDADTLERLKYQPTVLLVAPLSGHHATLLRETVRELLVDHKVYVTDWSDARYVPVEHGPFGLDDYVGYIEEFLRFVGPDANVVAVCQPTVPVLGAVSLMASRGEPAPRSMVLMGGPIDGRMSPTEVNNLATSKSYEWFEQNVIHSVPSNYPGFGRLVYPGFLQHGGFVAMNAGRHISSHYDYFLDLMKGNGDGAEAHRRFYDEYNAVLDLPAEFYLDTIRTVFQEFALPNGTWTVGGEPVRPQDIKATALMTVEGELDDISGTGQTHVAHDMCSSIPNGSRLQFNVEGAGHYGIFSGKRWRDSVYPAIRDFIRSV